MSATVDPASPPSTAPGGQASSTERALGPYRLEVPMAIDEVGVTFRGRLRDDPSSGRVLAVHVPRVELQRDERFQRRYRRDSDEARTFTHPSLLPVISVGQDSGLAWRGQAWIEGWELATVMDRCPGGALDVAQIAGLGVQLCQSLVYLHERADSEGTPSPLMHGNIGLGTVLLQPDGRLRVLGVPSPRGRANTGYGRPPELDPSELAPEHLRSGMLGPRSDLYQVGLLMYSLWIGGRPLRAATRSQSLAAVMAGVPQIRRGDQLPRPVKALLESTLSVDPSQRPASARQMASVLEAAVPGASVATIQSRWAATLGELFSGKPPTRTATPGLIERPEVQRLLQVLETPSMLPELETDESWALEEHTDVVTREELEEAAARMGVGLPPSLVRSQSSEAPSRSSASAADLPSAPAPAPPVAAPVEAAPAPAPAPPPPVVAPAPVVAAPPPSVPAPARPAPIPVPAVPSAHEALDEEPRSSGRSAWVPLFVVGGVIGLVLGLFLWPERPPAPPPEPVATPAPAAPAPIAAAPVTPPPAEVPAELPPDVAPEAALTPAPEQAAPAPEVAPEGSSLKLTPVSTRTSPPASTSRSAAPAAAAPEVAAPEVAAPTPAPEPAPAAAPEVAAPSAHLTDVGVSAAGGVVTVTGKVDSEAARPLGFLLEGGARGPQYVVRYKGVAATVASRELSVSSAAVRGVRVQESGGDTTVVVDLVAGADVTPRLRREAGGFVLTIEPAAAP